MSWTTRKLTWMAVVILFLLPAMAGTASAEDNAGDEEPTGQAEGCTQQQLDGGYEVNPDGSCGLTGWNWNINGHCPAQNDASVGDIGSVDCAAQPDCIGGQCGCNGACPGGSDGEPDPLCMTPEDCWGFGRFYPGSYDDFQDECARLGGSWVEVDLGMGFNHTGCGFGLGISWECRFGPDGGTCQKYVPIVQELSVAEASADSEYLDNDTGGDGTPAPTSQLGSEIFQKVAGGEQPLTNP